MFCRVRSTESGSLSVFACSSGTPNSAKPQFRQFVPTVRWSTAGVTPARELYVAHVILFFIGTSALANLLVLRPRNGFFAKQYVADSFCTVFAFILVLLPYTCRSPLPESMGKTAPSVRLSRTILLFNRVLSQLVRELARIPSLITPDPKILLNNSRKTKTWR